MSISILPARRVHTAAPAAPARAVYVIQNTGFPRDRRILRQARAAQELGYDVTVIAPNIGGGPRRDVVQGMEVQRFTVHEADESVVAFVLEYLTSFLRAGLLLLRAGLRPGTRFVQVGNPPDTLFPFLWVLRLAGRRIIFDQHELMPELLTARFGRRRPAIEAALRWCERRTYGVSHLVVATNETYAAAARDRGGKKAHEVVVVRNGPDRCELPEVSAPVGAADQALLVYVGVIGPQDGVDNLVEVAATLARRGRDDVRSVVIGDGSAVPGLKQRVAELGLEQQVHFTGWVDDQHQLRSWLSAASICLCPEPSDPFNDASTLIKVMEYMAAGKAMVAFDLTETRFSAGVAARYAPAGDLEAFADAVEHVLDHPVERRAMEVEGLRRIEHELGWWNLKPGYQTALVTLAGPVTLPELVPVAVAPELPATLAS